MSDWRAGRGLASPSRGTAVPARSATAHDSNAGFGLLPKSNHRSVGATPWLQRERCVPEASQPHIIIGTRALACCQRVITAALVQCLGCSVNAAFLHCFAATDGLRHFQKPIFESSLCNSVWNASRSSCDGRYP